MLSCSWVTLCCGKYWYKNMNRHVTFIYCIFPRHVGHIHLSLFALANLERCFLCGVMTSMRQTQNYLPVVYVATCHIWTPGMENNVIKLPNWNVWPWYMVFIHKTCSGAEHLILLSYHEIYPKMAGLSFAKNIRRGSNTLQYLFIIYVIFINV